jgi:hypothetical protein
VEIKDKNNCIIDKQFKMHQQDNNHPYQYLKK